MPPSAAAEEDDVRHTPRAGASERTARRRADVVSLDDDDSGPLAPALFTAALVVVCVGGIVGANTLPGWARVVAVIVAVVAGLYACAMIVPLLLFAGPMILLARSAAGERPGAAAWGELTTLAVLVGAAMGTDTYVIGPSGLLAGPLLVVLVAFVLRRPPAASRSAQRTVLILTSVAAVAAVGVGLTVFG